MNKNKNLNPTFWLMHVSRNDLIEDPLRKFVLYGAKRFGIEDRLFRYVDYINSIGNKCPDFSIINHYVDSVFMKVLENTNQLAVVVDNNSVLRYYRNKFTKALSTRDKEFIRWFLKNYVQSYTDVDAVVSENTALLPCLFNYCFHICPAWGSSCVSSPSRMCFTGSDIGYQHVCCTDYYLYNGGGSFDLVDDPPWINTYSSDLLDITGQASSQSGVLTLTANVTTPTCFPQNGVDLGLDFGVNFYNYDSGNCASSCSNNTNCPYGFAYQCDENQTYSEAFYPVLYYDINYTFLPNSAYAVWWSASVS